MPDPTPTEALKATADQLFFIVGAGRSGTSLLQAMISSHPDAIIPTETKFYTVIHKQHQGLGDPQLGNDFDEAVRRVLAYWQIRDLGLDEAELRALCVGSETTWETILLAVLTLYARTHGVTRVGEKSPGHVNFLELLGERFPRARFIHLIRDPRAVVLSQIEAPFGTRWIAPNVAKWTRAARVHRRFAERLGDRYLLVRYEDLVADPDPTLRRVCDFLDLSFEPAMLEHDKRQVRGFADRQQEHMSNTLKPVFTSSLERWRDALSPRQVALIEHAAGDDLQAMGYERSGASVGLAGVRMLGSYALWATERSFARVRGVVRPDRTKP